MTNNRLCLQTLYILWCLETTTTTSRGQAGKPRVLADNLMVYGKLVLAVQQTTHHG